MPSTVITFIVALLAGVVSTVTGFGIGSLLTPVLALTIDTRIAVAAVSIPHALWPWMLIATIGVVAGTVLGSKALTRVPDVWFRRVLALLLAVLGIAMLARGLRNV